MKPLVNRPEPAFATKGNALIYLLWAVGILGTAGVAFSGFILPLADRDFTQLWVAGKLAASGHFDQVYDVKALRAAAAAYAGTQYKVAFRYPPHMLFIGAPLSVMPLKVAFFVWQAISALLFWVAARSYLPSRMPRWLAVLTPSAVVSMIFGQNGLFFGALWLFAFQRSAPAAALLTMKPNIGFLVAIEMFRRGMVLRTAAIAIAVAALAALMFGLDSWRHSLGQSDLFGLGQAGSFMNLYVQMTTPYIGYGYVGWIAFAVVATFLLLRRFDVFTAATATFLISPYGFHYDMTVVCLGFGILLFRSWRTMRSWETMICALAFLSPIMVRLGTWLVPPLLLVGLYVLSRNDLCEEERPTQPTLAGSTKEAANFSESACATPATRAGEACGNSST